MVQEAMLRAWRHRARCADPHDPHGWLRTIVRNESARRYAALRTREEADDDPAPVDELDVDGLALRVDVRRVLDGLDPLDRQLLELRYERDLTQPAIAEAVGMPEGTVKVRLHRLRKQLSLQLS